MTDNAQDRDSALFEMNVEIIKNIIKKLNNSDLISIFFLLIKFDYGLISCEKFLRIIEEDRNQKESFLGNILLSQNNCKKLLIEILWTIKRYDLLKSLKICRHKLQHIASFNCLDALGKSLYESFESEKGLKMLEEIYPQSDKDNLEKFIIEKYNNNIISKPALIDLAKRMRVMIDESYFIRTPTLSSPCGLAVILNHENFICEEDNMTDLKRRVGSHLDVEALEKLWKTFGFKTDFYKDLNDDEVLSLFENLSRKDFSMYDCFVLCYMSHGHEGVVYASNGKPIKIQQIIHLMANECVSLLNKPKLFFIQACQGTQIQCGDSAPFLSIPNTSNNNFVKTANSTSLFEDVLVASSTIPGFVSFGADGKHRWFIEALIENLELYGHKKHILDVMTKVNNQVSQKVGPLILSNVQINVKQTSCQQTSLRKTLQLKKLCP